MTPKRRRPLDITGSVAKWVAVGGAILALLKQGVDLRASNVMLSNSMATVVRDGTKYEERLARLERQIKRMEGKSARAKSGTAKAAPDSTDRPRGIVRRVGSGLWNFLFG